MKRNEITEKLIDFLDQSLPENEMKEMQDFIDSDKELAKELEEMKKVFFDISTEVVEYPNASLHQNFEELLQKEIAKEKGKVIPMKKEVSWKSYLRVAATILIVISAFIIGKFSNEGNQNMNEQILAQIQSESASQRIAALSRSELTASNDTKILQAFINRLFYDKKPSVRLAAVEALSRFTSEEMVKKALIKALETDKDPAIQIELIHLLAKIEEKRALTPMKNLLENKEVPEYVKKEIQFNIPSLEKS